MVWHQLDCLISAILNLKIPCILSNKPVYLHIFITYLLYSSKSIKSGNFTLSTVVINGLIHICTIALCCIILYHIVSFHIVAYESFVHLQNLLIFIVKYEKYFNLFTSFIWEIWSEVDLLSYHCVNRKYFLEGRIV